ncbi:MAG: heavy metal translocating P-type ATPase [Gemmatimonadota bacterium]
MSTPATRRPGNAPVSTRYAVEGLCCAAEARQIEVRLGRDPRVESLRIDAVHHTVDVRGPIPATDVCRAIGELGMEARPADAPVRPRSWWEQRGRTLLAAVAGILFVATLAAEHLFSAADLAAVLAVGAVVAGGWYVFPRGVLAARNLALDMNFLMAVAATGALLIGEFAEAAAVMSLFALAQLLEARSMDRARNAIRSLMQLTPAEATLLRDGREVRVPAADVPIGARVVVRPGERIAVDGTVLVGHSAVDQAPITGESIPAEKEPGAQVFAGTVNGPGALEIRSSRAAADTTLARIIHAVEEAQATRAPSQAFVERFARVYTPAVVAGAVALALVPPLTGFGAWGEWIYRALALLVVACPCALVISTPVTVVSALAGGARRGLLIKGGLHLENAGRVRVVALDKTGTLSQGSPEVVSVVPLNGTAGARVLALAAAVEARSEHPLAAAVRRRADAEDVAVPRSTGMRALTGLGVEARVDGRRVVVGSPRLLADLGASAAELAAARELEEGAHTVMLVAELEEDAAPRILGALTLADRVRPAAAGALADLRAAGIRHIAMLTGDNEPTARAIAAALDGGVDSVHAGLLPQDKVAAVRALRAEHGGVLMVGDGINDTPAMAAADVSVAMGAAGTDAALETADIALMADDLTQLPVLIRLARKAEGIIRVNIGLALLLKAVFVVLAAAGVATLWMAVLADMGASLLVIGNGLRALRV